MVKTNGFLKIAVVCALVMCFASCQSTKVAQREVESLDLLAEDSVLFLKVPVKENKEMFLTLFERFFNSKKYTESVYKYFDEMYIGERKSDGAFEMVGKGEFPTSFVGSVLKEKDGWKKEKYSLNGFSFEYYKNENYPLYQISFPNNKIICISPSVCDMLDRFVFLTLSGGAAGNESGAKNWFNAADNKKLLFYMPSFSALAQSFGGGAILQALGAAYGFCTPSADGSLDSDMFISVNAENAATVARNSAMLLKFALQMMGNPEVVIEAEEDKIHISHFTFFDF